MITVGAIVEGQGEVASVPVLLRRIADRVGVAVDIPRPFRVKRQQLVKEGEIERTVQFMGARVGAEGAILVLLDANGDCPAVLAPQLLERCRAARADRPSRVVIANREYEAWFLAAATSLAGKHSLPADLAPPKQPEQIRGAKEWLRTRMSQGYAETIDQAKLTASFDLDAARSAPSFDKLVRDVCALLGTNAWLHQ